MGLAARTQHPSPVAARVTGFMRDPLHRFALVDRLTAARPGVQRLRVTEQDQTPDEIWEEVEFFLFDDRGIPEEHREAARGIFDRLPDEDYDYYDEVADYVEMGLCGAQIAQIDGKTISLRDRDLVRNFEGGCPEPTRMEDLEPIDKGKYAIIHSYHQRYENETLTVQELKDTYGTSTRRAVARYNDMVSTRGYKRSCDRTYKRIV